MDDPLLKSCLLSAGLEFLICRASFMVTSKSFLAVSITLKELDEYSDWQVGQEDKWSRIAELDVECPCSLTLVAKCRLVLPM